MKIWNVMRRNIKLLLRSKTSALIVVLGPLLIIFLAGIAFNTSSLYSINIGVYDPAQTNLSLSVISQMEDFQLSTYYSEDECVQSVKWGVTHVCMVFPEKFELENNKTNTISFYADTSKVNLVYMVLDSISSEVSSQSMALSAGMTEVILGAIDTTRKTMSQDAKLFTEQESKQGDVLEKLSSAKNTLNSLNLNMPDVSLDDLEDSTDDFEDLIDDLDDIGSEAVDELDNLISQTENSLESIIEQLDDANLSLENADAIDDLLNDSEGVLEDLQDRLDNTSSDAGNQVDELSTQITKVSSNLNQVDYLLNKARVGRTHVTDDLEDIRGYLNDSSTILNKMKTNHKNLIDVFDSIKVTHAESIARPISTEIKPVSSEMSNLSYLYPGLIMLVLMFISLVLPSTLVIMERKSMATFRNFCTPTKMMSFMIGTFITGLFVVLIQMGIILGISAWVFQAQVNILALSVIIVVMTTLFILLGMAIGNLLNSQETVMLASISLGSLLLLLSDLILPIESMPGNIAHIVAYNPFIIGSDLLKKVILFNFTLDNIKDQLYTAVLYSIGIFIITYLIQSVAKLRFLKVYTHQGKHNHARVQLDATERLIIGPNKISNLIELAQVLKDLDDTSFKEYAKEHVFADWVKRAYQDDELAIKISAHKRKRAVINILERAHKKREKFRQTLNQD